MNKGNVRDPSKDRRPTPLLSPSAAVTAQLDALQINDWPDTDAGIRTAFLFCKPHNCESLMPGEVFPNSARSWEAKEQWLTFDEFRCTMHAPPYNVMLSFDSWQAISNVIFPSHRHGNRAIQAIQVMSKASTESAAPGSNDQLRPYTFSFCLERIDQGPYKGCWLTVGVRVGNYST